MAICASGEKLVQEATGIRRGRVYPVTENHDKPEKKRSSHKRAAVRCRIILSQVEFWKVYSGWINFGHSSSSEMTIVDRLYEHITYYYRPAVTMSLLHIVF